MKVKIEVELVDAADLALLRGTLRAALGRPEPPTEQVPEAELTDEELRRYVI